MNLIQTANDLSRLTAGRKSFLLKLHPAVFDFTNPAFVGQITLCGNATLSIEVTAKTIIPVLGLLQAAVFGDDQATVLCWDIKNLASFVKFHTKAPIQGECRFLDLKPLESILGDSQGCPVSLAEAMTRVKAVLGDENWPQARLLWQKIYRPLIFDVLPSLETQGIYDGHRHARYANYEVEGQVNGRLRCTAAYGDNSYVPHTLGPEQRRDYRPKCATQDEVFMYLDFCNMEVAVLRQLSGDEELGHVLDSSEDFYADVFRRVVGSPCDSKKKRDACKKFVLPVIYGREAAALARDLGVSQAAADGIIARLSKLFPVAFKWIQGRQESSLGVDYFGRRRKFDGVRPLAARNFAVQAPASVVCLEKLIALYEKVQGYARVACHIHDGYVLYAGESVVKTVSGMARGVLEQESELCPGLRLKTTCKVGRTLEELEILHEKDDDLWSITSLSPGGLLTPNQ